MANPEAKLQSEIVIDFSQKRPEERTRLFATFSEFLAGQSGGKLLSLGLVRSLPDLVYITKEGFALPIELKVDQSRHRKDHVIKQAKTMIKWGRGYFCDSKELFWRIIEGGEGICPGKVINYLEKHEAATFKWDKKNFQ